MFKPLRIACLASGILFFGSLAMFAYWFLTAEVRVRQVCSGITPGMPLAELQSFAREHGLRQPQRDSGIAYLVEIKTSGRWGCKVELEKGVVKSAEYTFAD